MDKIGTLLGAIFVQGGAGARFGISGALSIETPLKAIRLATLAREFVRDGFAFGETQPMASTPLQGKAQSWALKMPPLRIVWMQTAGLDIGNLAVLERYQQWRRFAIANGRDD